MSLYILLVLLMLVGAIALAFDPCMNLAYREPRKALRPLDEPCSICFETGIATWVRTPCGHMFHRACLQMWQQPTCPMCRRWMA
jgi:hypothetical protein